MIKKYVVLIALSASLLSLLYGCAAPIRQETSASLKADSEGYYTFDYKGTKRKYMLYVPDGIKENAPLVLMLHGYAATSKSFMDYTGMNGAAEKYGYAVVYPQGIGWGKMNAACWNSGFTSSENDDIGFLVALAEYLQQTYGLSGSETFAAGFSDGAYMAYKLACEAPDTFRAVASVAGSMSAEIWEERPASASIGVLQINGTKDSAAPIRDSASSSGDFGGSPGIKEVIEYWKDANNLDELREVKLSDSAAAYEYSSGHNDSLVWYIEIQGFGHEWPGKDIAGFSASEKIFEFFSHFA